MFIIKITHFSKHWQVVNISSQNYISYEMSVYIWAVTFNPLSQSMKQFNLNVNTGNTVLSSKNTKELFAFNEKF